MVDNVCGLSISNWSLFIVIASQALEAGGNFEAVMKERETRSIKQNISLNSHFFGDGDRKLWSNTAQYEMHIREYVRLKEI